MPAFLKTPEDEKLWSKAKAAAKSEYNLGPESEWNDNDWARVTGIWKNMKGTNESRATKINRLFGL